MKPCDFFGIPVEVEEKATREWYETALEWDCDCGDCRNFLALAKQKKLPHPVQELLSRLSIPPEMATYVCELCPTERGHLYEFSYRICGRILEEQKDNYHPYPWGSVRCWHEDYPYGAPGFPAPHFDLSFCAELEWILNESEEGEPNESEE